MIKLSFCQNDPPMGESFWQNTSLATHILFELCLLWYLAQSQICCTTLYFVLKTNFGPISRLRLVLIGWKFVLKTKKNIVINISQFKKCHSALDVLYTKYHGKMCVQKNWCLGTLFQKNLWSPIYQNKVKAKARWYKLGV